MNLLQNLILSRLLSKKQEFLRFHIFNRFASIHFPICSFALGFLFVFFFLFVSFCESYATYFSCHSLHSNAISVSSINPTHEIHHVCYMKSHTYFMREFDLRTLLFLIHSLLPPFVHHSTFNIEHRSKRVYVCARVYVCVYSKWDNA